MKRSLWLLLTGVVAMSVGPRLIAAETHPQPPGAADLPLILLEAKEPIRSETKVPCTIRMMLPKDTDPTNVVPGVIRIHGATSQMYPKKSFGITLNAPQRWLEMRESANWVLNAAAVDHSLMRHKLSYDLFRSLSTTNSPRFASSSRFVEVRLNGRYQGVYLLMERVDRALLGLRRYDSNALHHACIYKAVDHAAGFDHLGHGGFDQREPDPLLAAYWGPLDGFNRFASSARPTDFLDPTKGISARLDLDNTIDFHLLVLLTSNIDGFDKNLLLARDAPTTNAPPPRFFFVPWDYDATFGRSWEGSRVGSTEWLSNHLFDRLLNDPSYRKRFAARWKQLRMRQFANETICRMIDDNVLTLGDAVARNASRWRNELSSRPTFQEDVAQMKDWVTQRTRWLDREIERAASP